MVERFITSGEATLWTVSSGEGPALVLASGGPGCCDYLGPVAALLEGEAQVIRFEGRGCGRSSAHPPYDVETAIRDLEAIRQAYGLERWMVGGHSWGADLALLYAVRHRQRVTGLLCLSGGRVNNDREWHKAYRMRRDAEGEQLPLFEFPPNMAVNAALNASWHWSIQQPMLPQALASLDVPALFVYGSEDIRPSWAVERVARLLPQAKYVLIPGAAHYLWLTHAEALGTHLRGFVDSTKPMSPPIS